MKVICPISGVPFRTYDSIPISLAVPHPIFSVSYEEIVQLLNRIQEQEQAILSNLHQNSDRDYEDIEKLASLNEATISAINEKNWHNPVFKLYQTKHLTLLALMKHANLLENEKGFVARPSPNIIDAYFWTGTELFIWANTIRNPALLERVPKYRISSTNENMGNFHDYLEILLETKEGLGAKYRSLTEEKKLAAWEMAIALLTKRRTVMKKEATDATNHIAAKWALTITRCPQSIYPFWFGILSSRSTKILFDGVKVGEVWQAVTAGDLRELRDFLEDNLIGPSGEHKQTHLDDSEYYFIARQTVLNIVRRHIAIVEQGTTSYLIVNAATGDTVLNASDDQLEEQAVEAGLEFAMKPKFTDSGSKFAFLKAMAVWRHKVKTELLKEPVKTEETTPADQPVVKVTVDKSYEIL